MSRSNPTPTNPSTRYFTWKGSEGNLVYWDKAKEKEIEVKLPFSFLVLDQLAAISGYSEADESRYWSNEVRSVAKEELTVRTAKGTKQIGLYKDLADVRAKGAKYTKSIYVAYEDGGRLEVGNFKASGAALTAWIEFSNKFQVGNGKVSIIGSEEAKKGATVYFIPKFEWSHSTTEEDREAIELDKELQVYLSQALAPALFDRQHQDELAAMAVGDTVIGDVDDLNSVFPE